jgi:hypothetical protein
MSSGNSAKILVHSHKTWICNGVKKNKTLLMGKIYFSYLSMHFITLCQSNPFDSWDQISMNAKMPKIVKSTTFNQNLILQILCFGNSSFQNFQNYNILIFIKLYEIHNRRQDSQISCTYESF